MKKLTTILLAIILASACEGQLSDSMIIVMKTGYMEKAKKQKKLGVGLFVGGLVSTIASIPVGAMEVSTANKLVGFPILFFGGITAMISSIAAFVMASTSRQKAREVSFRLRTENRYVITYGSSFSKLYPAFAIQFKL